MSIIGLLDFAVDESPFAFACMMGMFLVFALIAVIGLMIMFITFPSLFGIFLLTCIVGVILYNIRTFIRFRKAQKADRP